MRPASSQEMPMQVEAVTETPVLITGKQVAILDFENRTGDPLLDAYGYMVGEGIATALAAQGLPVVSAAEASAADGLTIAGTYFLENDQLRFQARLLSASRGKVVRALEPVRGPRSNLIGTADVARQRVISAVLAILTAHKVPR